MCASGVYLCVLVECASGVYTDGVCASVCLVVCELVCELVCFCWW